MGNQLSDNLVSVLDKVASAMLLTDSQGSILFANTQARNIFEPEAGQLPGMQVEQLIAAEMREEAARRFSEYFSSDCDHPLTISNRLCALRASGDSFPVDLLINCMPTNGTPQFLFTVVDTTQQLQTFHRFKLAFEQSTEGMLIADSSGTILMGNPRFFNMFGYTEDELLGRSVEILLPAALRSAHMQYRSQYLDKPEVRRMGAGRELFGLKKYGTEIPLEISLAPLPDGENNEVLVTLVDLTQRRKIEEARVNLEAKIRQTQKLESLGILTGGIAHDFNNILTGIVGNAELAQMDLPPGSSIRRYLESILKASHRAADLCEQMLAYSGGGKRLHEALSLNELIDSTRDLIQTTLSKNASLVITLDKSLPMVTGDATQLRQVIMNLIINAAEALQDNQGVITVSTGIMDFQPSRSSGLNPLEEDVPAGKYVFLLVNDNGIGMSRETQEKIFDPFFTTKFTGRGLGLAAVLGIIHNHGGAIRIYSEEGIGTSFRILLPFQNNDLEQEEEQEEINGSGMILVIDDEMFVHQTISDALRRVGYTILSAHNGLEGLELFKAHKDSLALVILDLTMPKMGGEETYKLIRNLDPELPVMITSGFSEQDILQKFVGRGIAGFIQKPISPGRLIEQVQTTVAAHQLSNTGMGD